MDTRRRLLHEALIALAVVGGIMTLVTVLAWNWPPVVVVESGSMMHVERVFTGGDIVEERAGDVSYGRVGTIDPGDLVLVRAVGTRGDVETLLERGTERYGAPGDVIVYYAGNVREEAVPKIHRALAWVEVTGDRTNRTYSVHLPEGDCGSGGVRVGEDCTYDSGGIPMGPFAYRCGGSCATRYTFEHSGFLTQGDNNPEPDQVIGISRQPVAVEWIEGKARGEIPWIGLVKLGFAPTINQPNPPESWTRFGNAYAPTDLWVSLFLTLGLLVVGPIIWDFGRAVYARRRGTAVDDDSESYTMSILERVGILAFGVVVLGMILFNVTSVPIGGLHPAWGIVFGPAGLMAAGIGGFGLRRVLAAREQDRPIPPLFPSETRARAALSGAWGGVFLLFAAANFAIQDASEQPTLSESTGRLAIIAGLGLLVAAFLLYRSAKSQTPP